MARLLRRGKPNDSSEPELQDRTEEAVAEPRPDAAARQGPRRSLLEKLFAEPVNPTKGDIDHQAAEELSATAAPAIERLIAAVPGATSPEEAAAALQRQSEDAELTGAPANRTYFDSDTAETIVHYRVRSHLKHDLTRKRFAGRHVDEDRWRGAVQAASGRSGGGANGKRLQPSR